VVNLWMLRRLVDNEATLAKPQVAFGRGRDRQPGRPFSASGVVAGVLAHPTRVPVDHAIGDVRAFQCAIPTPRTLLAAAAPFEGRDPQRRPGDDRLGRSRPGATPWQAEVAKQRLPQAEHVMMRGVGHVPMWDDPRHVARILLRGSPPVAAVAPLTARARSPACSRS
jgi:pimeloyl-ACP methyl ester carboxylesterase